MSPFGKNTQKYKNLIFAQYPAILLHKWWIPIYNSLSRIGVLPRDVNGTIGTRKITDKWLMQNVSNLLTEKRTPTISTKWLDFVRRQAYIPKSSHTLCIKGFVEGKPKKNSIHTVNCFPIITITYKVRNHKNIRPSISIQIMDKMTCQTSTCTKSSYSGDYNANGVKVAGSL